MYRAKRTDRFKWLTDKGASMPSVDSNYPLETPSSPRLWVAHQADITMIKFFARRNMLPSFETLAVAQAHALLSASTSAEEIQSWSAILLLTMQMSTTSRPNVRPPKP
jgi:hypothetical protein